MNIQGIGVVFGGGRGADAYQEALRHGNVSVDSIDVPFQKTPLDVYRVPAAALKDKHLLKKARRADRIGRMAVLAAHDALLDGNADARQGTIGLVVATALGPHCSTFRFLDEILEYGDGQVSPTRFSHTVHNAAASYVAATLDVQGPTLTLTDFAFGFQHALLLAQQWLEEGRCENVLAGCVDELGPIMEYIYTRKLNLAADKKIKPFSFSKRPEAIPGEGSLFMLLSNQATESSHARVSRLSFQRDAALESAPIVLLESDGLIDDESIYLRQLDVDRRVCGYAPVFGSFLSSSAFHCAAAALMIRNQECFPSPADDNPGGIAIASNRNIRGPIDSVETLRYNCDHQCARVRLSSLQV